MWKFNYEGNIGLMLTFTSLCYTIPACACVSTRSKKNLFMKRHAHTSVLKETNHIRLFFTEAQSISLLTRLWRQARTFKQRGSVACMRAEKRWRRKTTATTIASISKTARATTSLGVTAFLLIRNKIKQDDGSTKVQFLCGRFPFHY